MAQSNHDIVLTQRFLEPGFVCLPAQPIQLCAVVSSGVALTIYDSQRRRGGMGHYVYPYRKNPKFSKSTYACPAIVTLAKMFLNSGSTVADLEAQLFGGADNPESPAFSPGISKANIQVGLEILGKLKIPVRGKDVGGALGRKIVFNTFTGETIIARVERIRANDWYPQAPQ